MPALRTSLVRRTFAPLVIALVPWLGVVEAARRASFTPLGRDQGIFQYVAWALRHGAIDYRDVRDVNGPLTHLVHVALLAGCGDSEHAFRVADLTLTAVTFALVGACLPAIASHRAPSWVERAVWALAACVVLGAQYLSYKYWDIAQRESFCDWFALPSVMLQVEAQAALRRRSTGAVGLMTAAGALSAIPWFGKPTFALFTAAQAAAVWVDGMGTRIRWLSARAFASGAALSTAAAVGLLGWKGDLAAFARLQWVDVPAVYRFIWPRPVLEILRLPWGAGPARWAAIGSLLLLALILTGQLPRRAFAIALLPVAALGGVLIQRKGFPYHFHPVTASEAVQLLVVAAWLNERGAHARSYRKGALGVTVAASLVLAVCVSRSVAESPYMQADWLAASPSAESRTTRAYFDHFPEVDFFPFEMRQAAAYLRAHTQPSDRVQTYGMDAYVLFLAQRLSATPYIYAYDLNTDAALAGVGARPGDVAFERIRQARDEHEVALLHRIEEAPPAAFVFFDEAPLLTLGDAWKDFEVHCPHAAAWVKSHYCESARFGHDGVWLRSGPSPELRGSLEGSTEVNGCLQRD